MKKLVVILILMSLPAPILSQGVTKVGVTAAGFLNIDIGARAIGMGGANVAVTGDVMSMYWNPAGITQINGMQTAFTYNKWIMDTRYNYAGFAANLGNAGTIGVYAQFLTMDDMERTTISEPDGTGEMFSAGSNALGLTYARKLTDRFSVGASFKYIREEIYNSNATGIAFDIGTLFETQFNGLKIGMSISNYGGKMQMTGRDMLLQADIDPSMSGNNNAINATLSTDLYDLPLMFRVGLAMDVLKGAGNSNLILAIDALHPNDDVESLNIGTEYLYNKMLALRAGYKTLFAKESEQGLCFGAGFQWQTSGVELAIDYAYQAFGVFDNTQMFSVMLGF